MEVEDTNFVSRWKELVYFLYQNIAGALIRNSLMFLSRYIVEVAEVTLAHEYYSNRNTRQDV